MNLKIYLKYTAGIFVGIIALYWIQFNLLPIPDAPTGLNIADFGLITGVGFWIERTIKFIIKSKPKKKTIANPYKDLEKENSNSYYIKIDKKLINKILIVLGVIAVFYVGYISGGNSNTSTQTITYNEEDFEWNFLYDSDGDIISDILYYKGSPFTGVTDSYYDNGQLESIATYTDGRMNGLYEEYYSDGKIKERIIYKDNEIIEYIDY